MSPLMPAPYTIADAIRELTVGGLVLLVGAGLVLWLA